MQCGAFVGEPLFAADAHVLTVRSAPFFLGAAERTEFFIQADFVAQLTEHDLGIDGVVEEAEAGEVSILKQFVAAKFGMSTVTCVIHGS